ncbi:MAG: substrate-binding domain-containing protein [Oscillospiraceae bacterium]|nr:substrate-binding domain-containing protein [Candidatus Equicaccousia limihippi]
MNIYIVSEQVGLEGYWITDILSGIQKESLKKNITVSDYNGSNLADENDSRPIVLAIGYSAHWLSSTCKELNAKGALPILVNADNNVFNDLEKVGGYVSFNVQKAVYEVMSNLVTAGHNRIAFLSAHGSAYSDGVKIYEFLRLASLWHLPVNERDVYTGGSIAESFNKLVPFISTYDAVFCSSDAGAIYVLNYFDKNGIKVPQDVAVVGYGNTRVSFTHSISLTTVENDYAELGKQAVKLHQLLQKNADISSASIMVDCPIIYRKTFAKPESISDKILFAHSVNEPSYRADPDFMSALQAEELLKNWDTADRKIARGIIEGKTVSSIADILPSSVSSVKYRIKKMLIYANLKNKNELIALIKRYNLV